jgi:transformation/transcription domain-associated protein
MLLPGLLAYVLLCFPLHHVWRLAAPLPLSGGRNRKFMRDPATLDYRDNPEHGMRLILTFK